MFTSATNGHGAFRRTWAPPVRDGSGPGESAKSQLVGSAGQRLGTAHAVQRESARRACSVLKQLSPIEDNRQGRHYYRRAASCARRDWFSCSRVSTFACACGHDAEERLRDRVGGDTGAWWAHLVTLFDCGIGFQFVLLHRHAKEAQSAATQQGGTTFADCGTGIQTGPGPLGDRSARPRAYLSRISTWNARSCLLATSSCESCFGKSVSASLRVIPRLGRDADTSMRGVPNCASSRDSLD